MATRRNRGGGKAPMFKKGGKPKGTRKSVPKYPHGGTHNNGPAMGPEPMPNVKWTKMREPYPKRGKGLRKAGGAAKKPKKMHAGGFGNPPQPHPAHHYGGGGDGWTKSVMPRYRVMKETGGPVSCGNISGVGAPVHCDETPGCAWCQPNSACLPTNSPLCGSHESAQANAQQAILNQKGPNSAIASRSTNTAGAQISGDRKRGMTRPKPMNRRGGRGRKK